MPHWETQSTAAGRERYLPKFWMLFSDSELQISDFKFLSRGRMGVASAETDLDQLAVEQLPKNHQSFEFGQRGDLED